MYCTHFHNFQGQLVQVCSAGVASSKKAAATGTLPPPHLPGYWTQLGLLPVSSGQVGDGWLHSYEGQTPGQVPGEGGGVRTITKQGFAPCSIV
jgi:hypothetical protein